MTEYTPRVISKGPDINQPINVRLVVEWANKDTGQIRISHDVLIGNTFNLREVLRARHKSIQEQDEFLASIAMNEDIDLALTADEQAVQITLDANRTYNAAAQAKFHIDMLVEHDIVSADDPEIREKAEQATAARVALKALTAEGADATAVEK